MTKETTKQEWKPTLFIDASGSVAGRVASHAAKQALLGKTIAVFNCEKVVITGNRNTTIREYREIRHKGGASLNGPFYPKHPDRIIKRMVRGMLRYTKGRGEAAFSRVRCFNGVPVEFKDAKTIKLTKQINTRTITLHDLGKEM